MWNEPVLGQTQTKRQHYVPRFYLKPFVRPDGKLRVSDLQEDREYVSSLENVAVQSGFYDVDVDGPANTSLMEMGVQEVGSALLELKRQELNSLLDARDTSQSMLSSFDHR